MLVEGLAAVLFQLSHTKDPLEVGGETTYEISVINQGSKASANLQIAVYLPPELRPLSAEGPTKYTIQDNKVLFESLPQACIPRAWPPSACVPREFGRATCGSAANS